MTRENNGVIKEIHSNGVDIKKKGRGSKTPIFTLLLSFSVALFTFYLPLSFIDFTLPFAELLGLARYQETKYFPEENDHISWASNCQKDRLFLPECLNKCVEFANQTVLFPKSKEFVSSTDLSCHYCPYYKPVDTLFSYLEHLVEKDQRQWGSVLDAGTGETSLDFLLRLNSVETITAVTVSPLMVKEVIRDLYDSKEPEEKEHFQKKVDLILGDWLNETLLENVKFDNIIADYLIGAMDGFTPYVQDQIFARLGKHLKDSTSRLFIIGMEPYPETAPSSAGELLIDVARVRDACILLHHQRPYREFPMEWITRQLEKNQFKIISAKAFPVIYGKRKLIGQLGVCSSKLKTIQDPNLKDLKRSLKKKILQLTHEIENNEELQTGMCFGMDYVLEVGI